MPIEDSQGTTITFGAVEFAATDFKVKVTGQGYDKRVDVSTLDLSSGDYRVFEDAVLLDPNDYAVEISCSYLGFAAPDTESEQTLVCSKFGLNGPARCTDFEHTAAVGEKIKGTATFVMLPS